MITEAMADAITGMAKTFTEQYAKILAIGFVEWAYREGWRQNNISFQWYNASIHIDGIYTTEQVFEKYEECVATLPPADVQLQSALS